MEINIREYNSVILGALLHDLGKVIQGSSFIDLFYTGDKEKNKDYSKHPLIGAKVFEKLVNGININDEYLKFNLPVEKFDIYMIKEIIAYHHEDDIKRDKEKLKNIFVDTIVDYADTISSRERKKSTGTGKDEFKGRTFSKLLSIFSLIKESNYEPENKYYNITKLREYFYNLKPEESDNSNLENEYSKIVKDFFNNIINISKLDNNFNFISTLISILEEHFSFIPSTTMTEVKDISLFDHLSTTSAIAASLYIYHNEKNKINVDEVKNEKEKKFLFIGGDIAGIQKFIFHINSVNPRKLSKELRGRSFLISLIMDLISLYILKELNLPLSNRVMNAGGKFLILAPNTDKIKNKLKSIYKNLQTYFISNFGASLIPVIDWSVEISPEDFFDLSPVFQNIEENLTLSKTRKIKYSYLENYKINKEYNMFLENGICDRCKIHPGNIHENGENVCMICKLGEILGSNLIKTSNNFVIIDANNEFDFNIKDNEIKLLNFIIKFSNKPIDSFLTVQINKYEDSISGYYKDIANYLPKVNEKIDLDFNEDNKKSLCKFCKNKCLSEEELERIKSGSLTFQCISTYTPFKNNGKGINYLAMLKGDVDDLGYIFSKGLQDKLSITRYAYLSRMLNLFFTYYLKEFIKEKYQMIYTIYAGGDDFLFLGPWEEIIKFAIDIRNEFSEYTGKNELLHFSAAIELFKPKQPVLSIVENAEELLEDTKIGIWKDRVNIFGEIFKWSDILKKQDKINEIIDQLIESDLSTGMFYKFLYYKNLYDKFKKTQKIEYLKYHYLFNYDVKRNVRNKEIKDILFTLIKSDETGFIKYLGLISRYILYKKRK